MKFNLCTLLLVTIFLSCSKKIEKGKTLNLKDIPKDTIQIPKNINIDASCLNQVKGYKNKYGIIISNYYKDENYSIDFDNNKTIDTIAVLKPYYENSINDCYPKNAEFDYPILLISKTTKNKSKIFKAYKNTLTSNGPNNYEEIIISNNGFTISKDIGGNNGFLSKTYISFKESDFYVDSISVESWGWHQYKKSLKFKNKTFELSKYKRTDIDSIRTILDK